MKTNWKYRFLVWICLRLRLSIALKRGYSITTFKLSNNAMAPDLRRGDLVAADTGPIDPPIAPGDFVVASIKCPGSQHESPAEPPESSRPVEDLSRSEEQDEPVDLGCDGERRLVVRRVAGIAGDTVLGTVVPKGCVYILANDESEGPDSSTQGIGPCPVSSVLGRVIAVRKGWSISWSHLRCLER